MLPPEGTNYAVSGTVRYRNKLTNQPDPLPNIKVVLSGWHYRDSTWTNSSGYYSITAPSGEYDLIIWAVNKAGEVHECWRADVDFIPPNADLYCSPFPHFFLSQEINLHSNLVINYNAEADKADWARILWRIKRDKDWMYNHTSPHRTLDYIEVSYPAEICIDLPAPWPNEIFVLERNPFYVYFGELEAVKVKTHDYSWLGWIGVAVYYRNPHQIVIDKYSDIWHQTHAIGGLSHEWSHGLMVSTFGDKVPYDWGHAVHKYYDVFNTGHAFSEGFAEFCGAAMWVQEIGVNTQPPTTKLEKFYRVANHPYYQGPYPYENTNGSFVEGSVFQFLWDLYDDRNTNDHEQNFDDDGVYGGIAKIMNTLASLGTGMTEESSVWDTLGNEEGDTIRFKFKKAHFPGPNYDFIGKYKDRWHALNYGDIDELYNVDIHPFSYLYPYPVPAPTNLSKAYINHVNKEIRLTWQDNTSNEGAFFVYRNLNNSGYVLHHAYKVPNATAFSENIQEGNSYKYKVRAFTSDTSSYSNELIIPTYVAAPSYLTVNQPTPISVKIYWQDNSQIEAGFQIARATDGVWNEDYADTFPNITEYIDTVTFLHKYHYKVRAYDDYSHYSEWSNVVEFTPGILAMSDIPQMSAFNNQIKTTVGSDGKIHLINYNGEKMYYTFSNDQGLNFDQWKYLYVDPQYPVDTTPGFTLDNNDIPYVVFGGSEWVYGTNYKVRYYVLEIEFPLSYPTMFYESDITTQTSRPTPPSITFAGDDCYIAFKHFNGSIIVAGPYGTPHTTISNWGYFPSIGYDESGNRLVVVVLPDICLAPQVFWRTIGSQIWHQTDIELPYDDMWGMGAPSLWVGQNELRVAFEAETLLSHNQPLPTDTFLYCVPFKWDSYENTYTAKPREKIGPSDADNNCIEGYSSFASKDVVLWKHRDDIWYSQKAGAMWTTPKNISDTPEPDEISSYPQGVVFGGGTRRKLFSLWTEKDGDDYHLARKVVNLPWAYPYVDVALSDIPEATGYNNSQRLLRDANNVLQLAFTSNDNVYHTSLQDTAWSEPVLVGRGKYPSLSLGADGKIYCTYSFHGYRKFGGLMYYVEYLMTSTYDGEDWSTPSILFHTYGSFLWGVGAPSMVVSDTMAYVTFKSYHGPHPHPAPGSVPPHIIVVEGPALIYGKFPVNNASAFTYEIIDTIIKDQIAVDTLTYRNSLVPLLISPSLAVDLEDVKHILWEGDSTEMRYYTIIDTSITCEFFDSEVDYPWLTMNGDRIDLFWTTRDSIRYRYGWTGTPNLSSSQTVAICESPISSKQYLAWTKQSGDLSYLYCGAIPANDAIAPIEVDYSTNLISYPQILSNPKVSNEPASIDLVWTDYDYLGSIGYIYHLNLPIEEPAPTYAFDMGTETPVPVIVQRHGYLALGLEDYQTFDYDSTELIYRMTLHSPHKKYKIRWTYYHEEPGKLKLQFNIDDILHHNRWVEPGEIVTEDAWLPQACLNDNEITIKVKRLSGTIAVLSGLEIEMHEVGGGGPQSAGIQPIKRFFFESMYPNPTKGVLKIRFNSPDERKVTVKMYDVVGRLAETIFNGKAKIGMNEFLIMPKELSVGVYFVRLKTEAYTKTEKVIFLR